MAFGWSVFEVKIGGRLKCTSCEKRIEGRASGLSKNNRNINSINGKRDHAILTNQLLYENDITMHSNDRALSTCIHTNQKLHALCPEKNVAKRAKYHAKGRLLTIGTGRLCLPTHAMQPKTDSNGQKSTGPHVLIPNQRLACSALTTPPPPLISKQRL